MPTSITSSGITFDDATTLATGVLPTANIANAAVTPAKLSQPFTLATSVASTSGTAIDFTGIPSWARRITVMFNGVSTSGTSVPIIQLGDSGGVETTGYDGASTYSTINNVSAAGVPLSSSGSATDTYSGLVTFHTLGSNLWAASGSTYFAGAVRGIASVKTLSGTLDRVRITTVNGTDTFDAGSINISYEG